MSGYEASSSSQVTGWVAPAICGLATELRAEEPEVVATGLGIQGHSPCLGGCVGFAWASHPASEVSDKGVEYSYKLYEGEGWDS